MGFQKVTSVKCGPFWEGSLFEGGGCPKGTIRLKSDLIRFTKDLELSR